MSDIIEDFLDKYYPSENQSQTRKGYRSGLKLFFESIDEKPSKKYLNVYDKRGYINNNKVMKIEDDLTTFFSYLKKHKNSKNRNFTPLTIKQYVSKVHNFLRINRVNVSPSILKTIQNLNLGCDSPVSVKGTFKPKELREVLANCNPMYKSLFLLLATSGIRIGVALKLEERHIKINEKPVRITIDATLPKKRRKRETYITDEAKEYYLRWMKKRDEYIKDRKKRLSNKTIVKTLPNEQYIFPICVTTSQKKWERIIDNTEHNNRTNETNRLEYTIHSLRRFFVNQLEDVGIDKRGLDFMKDGILSTGSYSGYENAVKNSKKEYIKGQHNLRIFESGIPEEEYNKIKQQELEKSRMVLDERENVDKRVEEAVNYTLRHNVSAKIMDDLKREKALVIEIKRDWKTEREYSIIISKILSGEIKVSRYEKKLVLEFGVEGLPHSEEELDNMIENNAEFLDLCELIERIIKERRDKETE